MEAFGARFEVPVPRAASFDMEEGRSRRVSPEVFLRVAKRLHGRKAVKLGLVSQAGVAFSLAGLFCTKLHFDVCFCCFPFKMMSMKGSRSESAAGHGGSK